MGHTYTNLMYHVVFSTKHRRQCIDLDTMGELVKVMGGIIRDRDGKLIAMNGMPEHVHLLTFFHAKRSVSELLRDIKAISSGWMRERFSKQADFSWQEGYGAFSVSKSNAASVEDYIANQPAHHRQRTFEEELIALLERHGIEYDNRYVFD